ncbi:MAG: hypothetical protein QMD85_04230 [Candidatus Aenigmarchaeota archaeon]|nr:hypothetical protein [Candidatus Aenigmarchaeota archaeon]MDI6722771.1 hypothetical protein [Candidatus Aenigmarchaeota archaeon]
MVDERGLFRKMFDYFHKTSPGEQVCISAVAAGTIGVAALILFWEDPEPQEKFIQPISYRIERHDADQVFRDHNGYRVYFDNESGEVIEKRYYEDGEKDWINYPLDNVPFPRIRESDRFKGLKSGDKHVKIYRDLPEGEEGYADAVHYNVPSMNHNFREHERLHYVEIHLPVSQKLSPGTELWGGKFPRHDTMKGIY